jgi:hypothetical protein
VTAIFSGSDHSTRHAGDRVDQLRRLEGARNPFLLQHIAIGRDAFRDIDGQHQRNGGRMTGHGGKTDRKRRKDEATNEAHRASLPVAPPPGYKPPITRCGSNAHGRLVRE